MTPWTVAYQAPLSIEFSRQEYWSGLPFPSPGDLPDLGIEPRSLALQADALPFEPRRKPYCHLTASLKVGKMKLLGYVYFATIKNKKKEKGRHRVM